MKITRRALLIGLLAGTTAAFCLATNHKSETKQHLYVVKIPLRSGIELKPVLAKGKVTRSETFDEVITRLKPYAAINGTFYDPEMRPLGDVLVNGKLVNRGHYPNAIAVKDTGEIVFVRRIGRKFDWHGYKTALAAGPRLVHKGRIRLNIKADGFREIGMTIRATRSAVGITKNRELLLVVDTDPVTIPQMARTMLDLGAVEAMNLDGGPASGLYHNGRTLVSPLLRMTNVLTVNKLSNNSQSRLR